MREWCAPYSVLADVGAHHGHLVQHLQSAERVLYATELTMKGYQELTQNISSSRVTALKGDGLVPLYAIAELECVIVSGMGYDTILGILENYSQLTSRPHVIVQPVQGGHLMHQVICDQHWTILKAQLISHRRRHYPTWLLDVNKITSEPLSRREIFLPTEFRGQPGYGDWLMELDRQLDEPLLYNRSLQTTEQREWLRYEIKK